MALSLSTKQINWLFIYEHYLSRKYAHESDKYVEFAANHKISLERFCFKQPNNFCLCNFWHYSFSRFPIVFHIFVYCGTFLTPISRVIHFKNSQKGEKNTTFREFSGKTLNYFEVIKRACEKNNFILVSLYS